MRDRIDCARIIFAEFQAGYEMAPGKIWTIDFDTSRRERIGLSQQEAQAGIAVLSSKHLIRMMGTRAYRLDSAGTQACIHPELLEQHLGPKHAAPPLHHITINAREMNNTQIGDHNNINAAAGAFAFSATVPEEKRPAIAHALAELREDLASVDDPDDRGEASATLAKVEQQLGAAAPRLDRMKKYLELYATIVTVASPTVDVLQKLLQMIFGG
jgi:hypothetical protein